jgi:Fe-S oxidoreductase
MHPLIDPKMVESIRNTGKAMGDLPDRKDILLDHGLPFDQVAENVIVTGCLVLSSLAHVIKALHKVLDGKGISHTFLSKEFCCGNLLYRPAIQARDSDGIEECRGLSREFVERNLDQAKRLGAKRIVIFCSPCYPIYKHAFPEEEIIFYPAILAEAMGTVPFHEEMDYYAGCYRLHRKFSPVPMDLQSTENVLSRLEGVRVNRIDAPRCCYTEDGLAHMLGNVKTGLMVHICTGCYGQAIKNMPKENQTEVLMLPELIDRLLQQAI